MTTGKAANTLGELTVGEAPDQEIHSDLIACDLHSGASLPAITIAGRLAEHMSTRVIR
jgi:hypothetical protein